MYEIHKFKKDARSRLKSDWLLPVLITLFCGLFLLLLDYSSIRNFYTFSKDISVSTLEELPDSFSFSTEIYSFFTLLISFILTYAQISVYVSMLNNPEKITFQNFIDGFGLWAKAVLAGLWQSFLTLLWSLLFIIPGIVKHYAYSQTKYLIADNKNLSPAKAVKISRIITNGHKSDLFLTDLSFILWILLSILSFGLGFLIYLPYRHMTLSYAYKNLLNEALKTGKITAEDLG